VNIGVVTTSFPRWPGDFAGSFVESSVRRLLAEGHSVDVVAAGDAGPPATGSRSGLRIESGPGWLTPWPGLRARLLRLSVPRAAGAAPNLFYERGAPEVLEQCPPSAWLQAAGFCAGLCRQVAASASSWDEIHAHWLLPSALFARAASRGLRPRAGTGPGVPVRGFAHSGDVALLERLIGGRTLARWLGRELTEITFASADLEQRFLRQVGGALGARTRVSRPVLRPPRPRSGSAPAEVAARRARVAGILARPPAAPVIVAVGRLVPIKGFDLLLKAAALSVPGATRRPVVVIVGDGPERARLGQSSRRLGVELRVTGFVPAEEVEDWLDAADVYVQPSRRLANGRTEGLPVSTLEALAHGLPVIASDSGGLAELATQAAQAGQGSRVRLFAAGDHRALAAALTQALEGAEAGGRWSGGRVSRSASEVSGA
jgi:glycosyltransferase involved in cell wall biosynthesis